MTRPSGKVSLNPTPLSDVTEFVLFTLKLSAVEPFNGTLAAPKVLMRMGGATTVTEALEVFPVPACMDVVVTVLFLIPAVIPVTSSEIVQDELTASVPADRLTNEVPATAVVVPVQVVTTFGGVPTTKPAGRLSLN